MRLDKHPRRRVRGVHRGAVRKYRHRGRSRASARQSSNWRATCRTTSSASRTRRGTTCARRGGSARRWTSCTTTLRRLLSEQQTLFEAIWQRLTLPQRGALRAVVLEDGRELLGADVRTRHRLGGPSTVQAALAALVRDDVLAREGGRYIVVDSLLREWVARRTF